MRPNFAQQYLEGLDKVLPEGDREAISITNGASKADLKKLVDRFPYVPQTLLDLLGQINGTYFQDYGGQEVSVCILGSDVFEYPYYLKSVDQILDDSLMKGSIRSMYADYLEEDPDLVGRGINPDQPMENWLCFSDCMNNGGTSQLFIDFNPTPDGKPGQVVRYLHDPDSFKVIAVDFDAYLQQLMDANYSFVIDPDAEEEE